jgi:hypothetical protein
MGSNVVTAGLGNCSATDMSGTSASVALVAGAAALIRDYFEQGALRPTRSRMELPRSPLGARLPCMMILNTCDDHGVG